MDDASASPLKPRSWDHRVPAWGQEPCVSPLFLFPFPQNRVLVTGLKQGPGPGFWPPPQAFLGAEHQEADRGAQGRAEGPADSGICLQAKPRVPPQLPACDSEKAQSIPTVPSWVELDDHTGDREDRAEKRPQRARGSLSHARQSEMAVSDLCAHTGRRATWAAGLPLPMTRPSHTSQRRPPPQQPMRKRSGNQQLPRHPGRRVKALYRGHAGPGDRAQASPACLLSAGPALRSSPDSALPALPALLRASLQASCTSSPAHAQSPPSFTARPPDLQERRASPKHHRSTAIPRTRAKATGSPRSATAEAPC